jgi:hypothetical protein
MRSPKISFFFFGSKFWNLLHPFHLLLYKDFSPSVMSLAVIVLKIAFPLLIPTMKIYLPLSVIPYTRYLLSAPFLTYGLLTQTSSTSSGTTLCRSICSMFSSSHSNILNNKTPPKHLLDVFKIAVIKSCVKCLVLFSSAGHDVRAV